MFGYKPFEKYKSEVKRLLGASSLCACPCAFICLDGDPINCVLCERKKKRKNHKGKQRLRKQRGRCRSRLLPGIVRITDEGGGWGKVRTLLNRFTNRRKPLSPSRWLARLGSAHRDFLHVISSVSAHQPTPDHVLYKMQSWYYRHQYDELSVNKNKHFTSKLNISTSI